MTVRALTLAGTVVIALGAVSGGTASSTRWIVFAASPQHGTQPTQLFRVSTTGTGLRQITTGIRSADDPAFSPDGKRVAFTRALSGLFVMNADGTGLRRLTGGRDDRYPVWSPNGRSIAFLHPLRNGFRLYLIKLNGREQHRLRFAPKDVGRPSWLPDGKSILVPAGGAFYEVSATSGRVEKRLVPTYETGDGPPYGTLSPNGRTIAIVRRRPEPAGCEHAGCEVYGLYLVNVSSMKQGRLVDAASPAGWSPDSRRLVYVSAAGLDLQPVAGGAPKSLSVRAGDANALTGDAPPAWQP
jgi:Tol biopolymer transport system component